MSRPQCVNVENYVETSMGIEASVEHVIDLVGRTVSAVGLAPTRQILETSGTSYTNFGFGDFVVNSSDTQD